MACSHEDQSPHQQWRRAFFLFLFELLTLAERFCMSRSLNKVMIIGNVGKDPEINYTGSGIPIAKMSVATTEAWKDKDGLWQEHTDWHNIVAWRGLAETIHKIVHKGTRIYVEGKLQSRVYEDRDGNKRSQTEVIADSIILLDNKDNRQDNRTVESRTGKTNAAEQDYAAPPVSSPEDDIPF